MLKKKFNPDLIVIGSNTPSLLLGKINSSKILNVLPPLKQATKISKTSSIAILATRSVIRSTELKNYIKKNQLSKRIKVKKIDASSLIELVESGKFTDNSKECKLKIKQLLGKEKILQEASAVAEQQIGDKFPSVPTPEGLSSQTTTASTSSTYE